MCNDFEGAIWAGEQYVAKGGKDIRFLSCLAMGYLYNGDYEKALDIYKKYKIEKFDDRTGKEIFLRHLENAKKAGIVPKKQGDVDNIIEFLNKE